MRRFVLGQLWHRRGRVLALAAGVLVAVLGFSVLTAAASTTQLRTVRLVTNNVRSAYDVLVRPAGSTIGLERSRGLVRPNYLSGIFGGITQSQYATIRRLPGVDVAAPIAMVGYVVPRVYVPLDLSGDLTGDARQLFRVKRTWVFDRGLSHAADADAFVYVTSSQLRTPNILDPTTGITTSEQVGSRAVPVCQEPGTQRAAGPFDLQVRADVGCFSQAGGAQDVPRVLTAWSFPLLIAAIDPGPEARLAGLDRAVVSGRYLRGADTTSSVEAGGLGLPVLTPIRPYDDEQLHLDVARLSASAARDVLRSRLAPATAQRRFGAEPGTVVQRVTVPAATAYAQLLPASTRSSTTADVGLVSIWAPGPVDYQTRPDGSLLPREVANPPSIWANRLYQNGYLPAPLTDADVQFRRVTAHPFNDQEGRLTSPRLNSVGEFDPARLPGFSAVSAVPLETYTPPQAAPGDAAARRALRGQNLLPTGNLGGYLQPPPLMLTTLRALTDVSRYFPTLDSRAPISVIRVRVAGVHGVDPLSRARVNAVATAIADRTGLDVDITVGSSPAPQMVQLPAGRFGRPPLALREGWSKKGVAVAILHAVDRTSVLLFALILLVCAVFVANAATAAVRARRTELGVLRALGWSTRKVFTAVLAELVVIGAVAGVVGVLLAIPVTRVLGLVLSPLRLAAVVPIAVALAAIAGLLPAVRAARTRPADAVRPPAAQTGTGRSPRGLLGLAATNLVRLPGRTAGAAVALGVGVAALTVLLGISAGFHGTLVGTLLGGAVAVRVRPVDYVAAGTTIALGGAAVADVLYLNVRERAGEFATLRAVGWARGALDRLVALEALGVGALGSGIGAAFGLAVAAALAAGSVTRLLPAAAVAAAAGLGVTVLAALAPLRGLRRLPTPVLLAEE